VKEGARTAPPHLHWLDFYQGESDEVSEVSGSDAVAGLWTKNTGYAL